MNNLNYSTYKFQDRLKHHKFNVCGTRDEREREREGMNYVSFPAYLKLISLIITRLIMDK